MMFRHNKARWLDSQAPLVAGSKGFSELGRTTQKVAAVNGILATRDYSSYSAERRAMVA